MSDMPVTMTVQMDVEPLAMLAHTVNKAYCESIGDYSQVPWKDASEHIKESARNGIKFHIDNPDSTPESSHENWMKEKLAAGWVYGKEKDAINKTHPCLVPYSELPQEQKSKDYIFKAIVDSALNQLKEYAEAMESDDEDDEDEDEFHDLMEPIDSDEGEPFFKEDTNEKKNFASGRDALLEVITTFDEPGKPDNYDTGFCDEIIERLKRRGYRLERMQ